MKIFFHNFHKYDTIRKITKAEKIFTNVKWGNIDIRR